MMSPGFSVRDVEPLRDCRLRRCLTTASSSRRSHEQRLATARPCALAPVWLRRHQRRSRSGCRAPATRESPRCCTVGSLAALACAWSCTRTCSTRRSSASRASAVITSRRISLLGPSQRRQERSTTLLRHRACRARARRSASSVRRRAQHLEQRAAGRACCRSRPARRPRARCTHQSVSRVASIR